MIANLLKTMLSNDKQLQPAVDLRSELYIYCFLKCFVQIRRIKSSILLFVYVIFFFVYALCIYISI